MCFTDHFSVCYYYHIILLNPSSLKHLNISQSKLCKSLAIQLSWPNLSQPWRTTLLPWKQCCSIRIIISLEFHTFSALYRLETFSLNLHRNLCQTLSLPWVSVHWNINVTPLCITVLTVYNCSVCLWRISTSVKIETKYHHFGSVTLFQTVTFLILHWRNQNLDYSSFHKLGLFIWCERNPTTSKTLTVYTFVIVFICFLTHHSN